jgi:hypothetical protein
MALKCQIVFFLFFPSYFHLSKRRMPKAISGGTRGKSRQLTATVKIPSLLFFWGGKKDEIPTLVS